MTHEEMFQQNFGEGDAENFFEIDFEAADTQRMDEDEKQRIRQELLELEW